MDCPVLLDDTECSVQKKLSRKPQASVMYKFVSSKKLKETLNEKLGACSAEKIVEQYRDLGQTMDDTSKEQSMQLPDDTVCTCSVPEKPSPKSQTSVRRKKVKETTIEKPSACNGETIAEHTPQLGQRLEDSCKDE